jgi:small subunit ribosomal protein S14
MFRAKKLDLGCFTNIRIIRDHSKRKAYEAAEAERYRLPSADSRPSIERR